MRMLYKIIPGAVVVSTLLAGFSSQADIVYDNSSNDLNTRFNPDVAQVGDQIILTGSGLTLTNFTFQYWGTGFGGNELAQIRFYNNDGTNFIAGAPVPNTQFFDSGQFAIGGTARATLSFDLTGLGIVATNNTFTWSVQFFNVNNTSEKAGVDLYSPPTVGQNYSDYWEANGGGWSLKSGPQDMSFAARVSAVPEPSILALLGLGGLAGAFLRRRK